MTTTTYNIPEAIKAQDWYCKTKILPRFAPGNGICWSCHQNIYSEKGARAVIASRISSALARIALIAASSA